MKFFTSFALITAVSAHTLFTTLYINGKDQGDGTCVRMPKDGATGTSPIYPVTGDAMACGYGGRDPVPFVCPAPAGARLTFAWREWPDASHPGSIDEGHKGPCAVYLKRVDDMFASSAAGPGWIKIWEDGASANASSRGDGSGGRSWCTDRLRSNHGLMSVDLPAGLPSGYYLVRPEILALHQAYRGDPQFYVGCAQVFIQGSGDGKAGFGGHEVAIPGYVDEKTEGLGFDIYKEPMPKYPMYGPAVYVPTTSQQQQQQQKKGDEKAQASEEAVKGAVPRDCLLKNANWCAKKVTPGRYGDEAGCWAAVKDCYEQSKACAEAAPASGGLNCRTWGRYCDEMNDGCQRGQFEGPPAFEGREKMAEVPGGGRRGSGAVDGDGDGEGGGIGHREW